VAPSNLNAVEQLVLIAKHRGPQFLDDAESFDRVLGRCRSDGADERRGCHATSRVGGAVGW
jgi:hypothetical protein